MRIAEHIAYLEGDLTLATARNLLDEGLDAMKSGVATFDLSDVQRVDSSALSLLFSWKRQAVASGAALAFLNTPPSLHSLADVYGVGELISI